MPRTIALYACFAIAVFLAFYLAGREPIIKSYQLYYLALATVIWGLGFHFFGGRFIRPKWKQTGKLIAYLAISWIMLIWLGHYALIFIIGHQMIGWIGHYMVCKSTA